MPIIEHPGAAVARSTSSCARQTAQQLRIIFAARHYLMRFASPPPCRFDVVLVQGGAQSFEKPQLQWLQAAFDAS